MDTTNEITPDDSVAPVYLIPLTEEEKTALADGARVISEEEARLTELARTRENALRKLGLTDAEVSALLNG